MDNHQVGETDKLSYRMDMKFSIELTFEELMRFCVNMEINATMLTALFDLKEEDEEKAEETYNKYKDNPFTAMQLQALYVDRVKMTDVSLCSI